MWRAAYIHIYSYLHLTSLGEVCGNSWPPTQYSTCTYPILCGVPIHVTVGFELGGGVYNCSGLGYVRKSRTAMHTWR